MLIDSNRPLLVLNASAGSGKTYNLVLNYLVLLLKESEIQTDPAQVIAMTFTNKAAQEMKHRIIRDLNKLTNPAETDLEYLNKISALTGLQPDKLQKSARLTLKKMLHRYEDFNVMTIDKFNLRLIRSFSRDLNLPENFEIVLDEQQILEKAIDELLNSIDKKNQNRLYKLAMGFAQNNLEEEARWDIRSALIKAAEILKQEESFEVIKNLVLKEFDEEDYKLWKLQFKALNESIREYQQKLGREIELSGITQEQLPGKSATMNALLKMRDTTSFFDLQLSDNVIKNLGKAIETGLSEPAETALNFNNYWISEKRNYIQLELKTKQFHLLSILRELAGYMDQIRENDAIIRISEFNKLISELVKDEEVPFIYEKLGNRFHHFFLDEFQDTSRLQWQNLVPLVHESLGSAKFNLIVGDPKQSIYRFKNGVAEQFVVLPKIYNPEANEGIALKSLFFDEMGQRHELGENWRSCKEIVHFNNQFFTSFITGIPESGQQHYNKIIQDPRGPDGGLITYKFFDTAGKEERITEELSMLAKWVNECIADGYDPIDICILARKKEECNLYANHLKTLGYNVVSSDSLLVNSDLYVRLIIAFCNWRNNPRVLQLAMRFAELYFRTFSANYFNDFEACFIKNEEEKKLFSTSEFFRISRIEPSVLTESFQDLFSLIQKIIRRFKINELKNAYVHQLLDIAAEFDQRNGPDLQAFLAFYDTKGFKTNVQLSENKNSIRIMTAHKSKGLEFPVVIIPSLKFDGLGADKKSSIIETEDHFLQVNYTEKNSILPGVEELVRKEKDSIETDALNLLYVAFTRPVDRLYFCGFSGGRAGKISKQTLEALSTFENIDTTSKPVEGTIGSKSEVHHHHTESNTPFYPKQLSDHLWFPDISIMSGNEDEQTDLHRQKRLGRQFHSIMEQAVTKEKALKAIELGVLKGTVEREFIPELRDYVERLFRHDLFKEIISAGTQLDEQTLLIDEKIKLRPDKIILHDDKTVIVDFKTGERKPEHLKQISDYVFSLNLMNYPAIEGYLYYVNEDALVRVNTGLL